MSGKERARASMSAVDVACLEGRRGRSVGRSPSQSNPRLKGKGLASFADHAHYTRGARARRSAGPPWARRVNETPLSDEGTNASCQRAPTRSAEPRRGYRRQAGLPVRPRVRTRRNTSLFNARGGYQGRREICREWRFLSAASRNGKGKIGGDLARPAAAIAAIRLFKVNERGRRARAMAAAEQWV